MKKGLFTKTVLATFISMTLVSTASAEFMFRAPVYGTKDSNASVDNSETETETETGQDGGETPSNPWKDYAEDNGLEADDDWSNVDWSDSNIDDLPGGGYPDRYPEDLDFSNNNLTDVDELGNINFVDNIDLSGNNLTNVDGLSNLYDASTIDLSNNPNLNDIGGIDNWFSSLTDLYLDPDIAERDGFEKLDENSYLCSQGNANIFNPSGAQQVHICDFHPWVVFAESRGLLYDSEFTQIDWSGEGIVSLPEADYPYDLPVETLNLSNNAIIDISSLRTIASASNIYLQNNNITSLDGLDVLGSVDGTLDLSGNSIKNLDGLGVWYADHIDLSDNDLSDISAFSGNAVSFLTLDLRGNSILSDISFLNDFNGNFATESIVVYLDSNITARAGFKKLNYFSWICDSNDGSFVGVSKQQVCEESPDAEYAE